MLARVLIVAGVAVVAATQLPQLFNIQLSVAVDAAPVDAALPAAIDVAAPAYGTASLNADARGHFQGDFRINGRLVHGVIDTGATLVAINESTARRLGFSGNDLDYRHTTQTANGAAKFAYVKLDRLEIGTIKVRDVDAAVMKDEALNTTLIGMSFLTKLASFGVSNNAMRLTMK
jgi:aspartyl protease family protein